MDSGLRNRIQEEVEKKCREHEFEFQWAKNDWLQISQVRPAVIHHPETGEKVWFNQAHLYDFNPKLLGNLNYLASKLFYCSKAYEAAPGSLQTAPRSQGMISIM